MADTITEANADEWITLAERSTVVELRQNMAKAQPTEKACSMVFLLDAEQHLDLSQALLLNGAKASRRGLADKEEAIVESARAFLKLQSRRNGS